MDDMVDFREPAAPAPSRTDEHLVATIRGGDLTGFEELMRRYNQRLFRVARAILKDEDEAQDALQQAYIQAYRHLDDFSGRAALSTWLTRIVINEALGRRRARRPDRPGDEIDEHTMSHARVPLPDPEQLAYGAELRGLIEASIDALPDGYRLVFVCRDVEGLTTAETATALEVGEEAVKTRLHRARAMLRRDLFARAGAASVEAFAFRGARCDAMVSRVLGLLAAGPAGVDGPRA